MLQKYLLIDILSRIDIKNNALRSDRQSGCFFEVFKKKN